MSKAASTKQYKSDMPMPMRSIEFPSTVRINLKKDKVDHDYEVGKAISFSGKGKVTSIRMDKYDSTMEIEVSDISCEQGG